MEIYRQGYDLQLTRYDSRMAGDILHGRDGALADERYWDGMGARAVACDGAIVSDRLEAGERVTVEAP